MKWLLLGLVMLSLVLCPKCSADDTDVAVSKALEAAYIQSGLKDTVQKLGDYAVHEAVRYHVPAGPALYAYRVYQRREVQIRYRQFEAQASQSRVAVQVKIPF